MTDEEMAEEYVREHTGFNVKEPLGKIAVRVYLAGLEAGSQLDRVWHDYDAGEDCYEDSREGRWVKRETSRPKWHDLRKDPKDLPKENMGLLLVKTNKGTYRLDMFIDRFMQDMGITKTIAWCEIPKFEVEK